MGVAARRMQEGAHRVHNRIGGGDRGKFQRLHPGMGTMDRGLGWRDKVVNMANRRPFATCLAVFIVSSAIIAEVAFLLFGYSTPPKEYLSEIVRSFGGL